MLKRYSQLARNFAVDAFTAEVVGAFGREGIEVLVLKGQVLARWLYPGEARPYGDSDLMVAPDDRARAVSVLERLGFTEHCAWMPAPHEVGRRCGRTPDCSRPTALAAAWWIFTVSCQGLTATRTRSGVGSLRAPSGR